MNIMIRNYYLLLIIFSSNLWAGERIKMVVGEYPPLVSEHLKYNGVTARIIVEAFASEGVTVEYKFTNWGRALRLVDEGQADGIAPILKNSEREKYYRFSEPILYETQVFFHKKDYTFNWETIDDLKEIKIGTTISYSYGKAFDTAAKSGELLIQRVPSDKQNIRKVLSNRIQIFPQSLDVGYYMLQTEFPDNAKLFTHHPKFVNQSYNYLALSKENPQSESLIKKFNRGLAKLKASGKYEQYFQESRRGDYLINNVKERSKN